MAKNSIFDGLLKPRASVGRNMFDLSQGHKFSSLAGQLVPVFAEDVQLNDFFDISSAVKCRTLPFNTAAWFNCDVNFDFFFVPYHQIWQYFEQFYTDVTNPSTAYQSTTYGASSKPNYNPQFLITDALNYIYNNRNNANGLGCCKLLDMLGYGAYYDILYGDEGGPSDARLQYYLSALEGVSFSPFRLCAYRKIWHDYYVQKWRDPDGNDSAFKYNLDDLDCSTVAGATLSSNRLAWLCPLHQVPYRKDIFMASLPSRQYGDVAGFNFSSALYISNNSQLSISSYLRTLPDSNPTSVGLGSGGTGSPTRSSIFSLATPIDVYSVKKAEALQKWKENHMRAGSRVGDQLNSLFGTNSYDDHLVSHIGGFSMQVMIDDVTSTEVGSVSESRPNGFLGELGGKGIGFASNDHLKYEVKEHGIIMCVASVVPRFDYQSFQFERQNIRLNATDYYNPMFDNLGMVPVTAADANGCTELAEDLNSPFGYAPQYWEYKTRVDKVHMSFLNGDGTETFRGSNAHFSVTRRLFDTDEPSISDFYIEPSLLDSVFLTNGDPTQIDTDQFLFDSQFEIRCTRQMSKLGLVNWNS